MTKVLKNISFVLLFAICLFPYLLVLTGHATISHIGGNSTMGVIIGPIVGLDRKSTRLNSSHQGASRMPSSA